MATFSRFGTLFAAIAAILLSHNGASRLFSRLSGRVEPLGVFPASSAVIPDSGVPTFDSKKVKDESQGEYSYAADIFVEQGSFMKPHCGGALISPTFVLTAAHCVSDADAVNVSIGKVELPYLRVFEQSETFTVKEVTVHPGFDPLKDSHNLALIELSSASSKRPIILPDSKFNSETLQKAGHVAKALEWGEVKTARYAHFSTPVLLQASMPILSPEECSAMLGSDSIDQLLGVDHQEVTCTVANTNEHAFFGDAGGPLLVPKSALGSKDDLLLGVTSYAWGSYSHQRGASISINVEKERQWIESVVGHKLPHLAIPKPWSVVFGVGVIMLLGFTMIASVSRITYLHWVKIASIPKSKIKSKKNKMKSNKLQKPVELPEPAEAEIREMTEEAERSQALDLLADPETRISVPKVESEI